MAYTIIRSNGTTLTTIEDGTINTTSTSLGLPGRNKANYGQVVNTNFVRQLESYSATVPPSNPLRGQLWYNTTASTLNVCPTDGESNAQRWMTLTSTNSGGSTTLGNVTVTGNVIANNLTVYHSTTSDTITVREATVTGNLAVNSANIQTGNIASFTSQSITTSASTTAGVLQGQWEVQGNAAGNAFSVVSGNIAFATASVNGIKCDKYMYANGAAFNPSGTYTNDNVKDYLTGANLTPRFTGEIIPSKVTTSTLAGGGTIEGTWTLATGARIQATYADLAERYEADAVYSVGTLVELGGDKEVTVAGELSEDVFGVVSNTAAYLMNSQAGDDDTHPAIALTGRVMVKAIGKISKKDRLVSAGNGFARAATKEELTPFNSFGRALSNKDTDGEGTIEAVVIIK
jgi:hypothetical protein